MVALAVTSTASVGALLVIFVPVLYNLYDSRNLLQDLISSSNKAEYISGKNESYDFIIIGGGSAGAVVANRLSKKYQVLLLEAGGDPNPVSDVPYLQGSLLQSSMDYQYETTPQKNSCLALEGQKMQWPRGKALGGCSSINNMLYLRGNPRDFDSWANLTGDPGLSYKNLLPFFKRSEDYHGNYEQGDTHEVGNELYVGKLDYVPPIRDHFFESVKDQGLSSGDFNTRQPAKGFMRPDFTIKNGRRISTFSAFLQPELNRTSLHIYRYAKAIKIHLDESNRAYGVTYERHQKRHFVRANREIILSGGTVDSAKLLLLSGIGPKDHLESLGIKSKINLPVGQNLQDHVSTFIGPILVNDSLTFIKDRDLTVQTLVDYFSNSTGKIFGGVNSSISGFMAATVTPQLIFHGPSKYNYQFSCTVDDAFSSPQERFANGYFTSSGRDESLAWPDVYFILFGYGVHHGYGKELSKRYKGLPGVFEKYYDENVGKDGFIISVILAKPLSVGEIRLAGKNPELNPIIDPNYYSDPSDMRRVVEGIQWISNLLKNSSRLASLGTKMAPNKFPGCKDHEFESDKYWECYAKHFTTTLCHPTGTVRMGSGPEDPKAVVDTRFRVLHTVGLRVVDASVIPEIVNGNTNAATIMLGELGSEYILQDQHKAD